MSDLLKIEIFIGNTNPTDFDRPTMEGYLVAGDKKFEGYVNDNRMLRTYNEIYSGMKGPNSPASARRPIYGQHGKRHICFYVGEERDAVIRSGLIGFMGIWPKGVGRIREFYDEVDLLKGRGDDEDSYVRVKGVTPNEAEAVNRVLSHALVENESVVYQLWRLNEYAPINFNKEPAS